MNWSIGLDLAIVAIGIYAFMIRKRIVNQAWQGFGGDRNSPLVRFGVGFAAAGLVVFGLASLFTSTF